ncbi:lipocalin-like domain-containing protein [Dyadobacter sandarakinus]|uniref:Lipocalin family protein n=1 Tax=Dyadobacter sandarakinus TaxID=2747268 RepID=A0ABX7IAY3_9BACT|nr:lipocalin family protein [Dyadobacter sandarakinus]QRR02692.1 lipocalin family protein [Dyadobacter sandarakinus]
MMSTTRSLHRWLAFVFVLMTCTFMACKDDDDDKEPDPVVNTDPIVGTWQLTSITPETAGTTIPELAFAEAVVPCLYMLKVTFKADNSLTTADCEAAVTAIGTFIPVSAAAKWKVEGDSLTLTQGTASESFKRMQTDTELTLVVNTVTDSSKPAKNALLHFKKI